ncbi:MAG: NTP transferase domain-containing protein [Vicingus serpentipes]|nr:NTP transferase domain-containing protein [Vicingus serpentipes]
MKVVILAGGLGTRLKPFTDLIPKPLLPLGEKSLLELQIELLKNHGFDEIFLAVNYKAEMIKSQLGDGSRYGVKLKYSLEEKPLGTCGPVALLKNELKEEPFLLMNGDILTKANFSEIYNYALQFKDSDFTIITKNITTPFRFGSITSDGDYVTSVEEKPNLKFEILAGMYIIKPQLFDIIPDDTYFGIDDLIHLMLAQKRPITKYLLEEYWLDIGVVKDYEKAKEVYQEHFNDLKN